MTQPDHDVPATLQRPGFPTGLATPAALGPQPFVAPPELAGRGRRHAVAIVGAGPVGLTAALTLARAGIDCVVIEDDDRVCTGSRALGMSRRTLEIWDSLGAVDRILAHGKDWNSGRSFYAGQTVLSFQMPDDQSIRHRPMFNIQQCYTEHYLLQALAQCPSAEVRWRSRMVSMRQDGQGAILQVTTPQGDYELQASYVIACDGARSAVRSAMGLKLEGESYEASYLIADIKLASDSVMERRCWFDPPSNPGLTVLMHGQPDGLWRLDYQLADDEDRDEALQPEQLERRIQKHLDYIGETGPWTLEWSSLYKVHNRSLDRFDHGRVLFAGDAAHLMPIFGIRGLNSGVEDAWNLGCKLVEIIRDGASPALLSAYSDERRRVYDENAALARRNALFMTPPNAGIRMLRDAVLSLSLGDTPVQDIINPKQATYVPLRQSPLSVPDDAAWRGGPAPGEVLPDLRLDELDVVGASHLQAVIDKRHALLVFAGKGAEPSLQAVRDVLGDARDVELVVVAAEAGPGVRLVDAKGRLHERLDGQPGAAYLVRQDHHVAARWKRVGHAALQAALDLLRHGAPTSAIEAKRPALDLPLTPAETIYESLGNALDETPADSQRMLLMKLALRLGLDHHQPVAFEKALEAAKADLCHIPATAPTTRTP